MYHLKQGLINLIFGKKIQNKFYTIIIREKPSICYLLGLILVQITWYSFLYNMFWATEPLEILKRSYQSLSRLTACEVNQAFSKFLTRQKAETTHHQQPFDLSSMTEKVIFTILCFHAVVFD